MNTPIKRHRLAKQMNEKKDPSLRCIQEIHFKAKDTQTESERMEKDIPCKWKLKKTGVAVLI